MVKFVNFINTNFKMASHTFSKLICGFNQSTFVAAITQSFATPCIGETARPIYNYRNTWQTPLGTSMSTELNFYLRTFEHHYALTLSL